MEDDISYLGARQVWDGEQPFGLSPADRRQHLYVVGKTGTGKSTLLRNLIVQDIYHGHGVGLIDPHGDLAEDVLDCVPPSRINDVVYFNPSDVEHPISFNLLYGSTPEERNLVTSGIVASFKHIWGDSWGPRMEYLLHAAIAALQECQNVSLLGLPRMLVDARYRAWVVRQVNDPIVRAYWLGEFEGYDKRFRAEIIAPVQNKVGQLLMSPALRNVLGQVNRKVDLRFAMDRRKIFVANLSKGKLGEDKGDLLGSLLVTQFQLAAMSRSDVPEGERPDFHLYVDEFQNFATDSFASILSESRKYRLSLTLAHQYSAQVDPKVRDAVFGNVGTLVSFRVGDADATLMEREFSKAFLAHQFAGLNNHEALVRPMVEGRPMAPFRMTTMAPLHVRHGTKEKIVRASRQRFGSRRVDIERRIVKWMEG